jgi:hypothetical protein
VRKQGWARQGTGPLLCAAAILVSAQKEEGRARLWQPAQFGVADLTPHAIVCRIELARTVASMRAEALG